MYPFCGQNEQKEDFTTLRVKCPAFLEDLANYIRAAVEMDWWAGLPWQGSLGMWKNILTCGGWGQGYLSGMHIDFWEFSRTVSAFLRRLLLGLLKWKRWWIWNSFGSFGRSSCKRRWTSSPTLCPLGAILPPPRNSDHQDDHTVDGRNPANHLGCLKPCKQWDKLPTSTGAGFQPSIVFQLNYF